MPGRKPVSAQHSGFPFSEPCFPHLQGTDPGLAALPGAVRSELELPLKK